jgi:hypothetical protein
MLAYGEGKQYVSPKLLNLAIKDTEAASPIGNRFWIVMLFFVAVGMCSAGGYLTWIRYNL